MLSTHSQISAVAIGVIAKAALANSSEVVALGVTSRGLFLKSAEKWVVFLSFEPYCGPLTVNLNGDIPPLKRLTTEERLLVSPDRITASGHPIDISLNSAELWQPAPVPALVSPKGEMQHRLRTLAQRAHKQKSPAGLSDLIPLFLGGRSAHPQADTLKEIHSHYQNADIPALTQILGGLLGLGGGLTPSWDDFTLGLLLTINRWGHEVSQPIDIESLNAALAETAYARTTTISANLIECAASGQADERLIAALDYIITGKGDEIKILNGLLGWGNSSGVDALLGMLTTLG